MSNPMDKKTSTNLYAELRQFYSTTKNCHYWRFMFGYFETKDGIRRTHITDAHIWEVR